MDWNSAAVVIALLGFVWGIWAWIYGRRERLHKEERTENKEMFSKLKLEIDGLMERIQDFMIELREEKVAVRAMKESFHEHIIRIDRRADRHGDKIDALGKLVRNE